MNSMLSGVSCALLVLAGTTQAQIQLAYDDGTAESAAGRADAGTFSWMNNFDTPGGSTILQSVEVSFSSFSPGNSGLTAGSTFFVYIFGDSDSDPTNGLTGLASFSATVDAAALDTNQFQSVDVGDIPINTSNFWVAIETFVTGEATPAPVDNSQLSMGRSWLLLGSTPTPDISNALELDDIGFNGVFLLRATVIPAPASAVILGLAGFAASRRRR